MPSGGPITADNSGAEIYCTIFAFRESPHEAGVFWAGSDDGLLHISRDGAQTWQNVTPTDLPEWAMINMIEPSPRDAATVYVAATCYKSDDLHPYLYRTNDYGATWTRIIGGLPEDEFTRVIREDPARRGLLYCGTERGIWVSFDDGLAWQRLESNLPITPIWDLTVKGTDLIAATHGRAFWILDDITPLHQLQSDLAIKPVHLLKPRDTVRFRIYGRAQGRSRTHTNYKMSGPVTVAFRRGETASGEMQEQFLDAGRNPPNGVIIHYWLRDTADSVQLTILDGAGNEVRSFSSKRDTARTSSTGEADRTASAEGEVQQATAEEEVAEDVPEEEHGPFAPNAAGMNRFVWDYRYATPVKVETGSRGAREEALEGVGGPRALPGDYQVRLTVGDQVLTESFRLLPDPRLAVTQAELERQFALKLSIRERTSETNTAVNQIRRLRAQVEAWEKRAGSNAGIRDAARAAKDQLRSVEVELINVDFEKPRPGPNRVKEKLDALSSMIDESDDPPTQGALDVYELLRGELESQLARLRTVLDGPVAEFNAVVAREGLPAVGV